MLEALILYGVHDWNTEVRNWSPSYNPEARGDFARGMGILSDGIHQNLQNMAIASVADPGYDDRNV